MSKYRRAKKVDANQPDIVNALNGIPGVTVETDRDDIIVGYKGKNFWFEIKSPDEITKSGKTRRNKSSGTQERQEKKLETWTGHYSIVWELDQILLEIGV